jgi:putative ABC transport system permease protein
VPEMLGGNPAAMIHQTILIRGIPFEILGVLSSKGAAGGFTNPDEQILIPLQTAQYRVFGSKRLRSMGVQVKDGVPIEQGMVDLERVLRREHHIRPGGENDFTIRNQQDVLQTQQQATEVFTTLLASIAAVSLVVGGIGIMNIMLVSVTERTREIGVRKALGATRGNILLQFLIEALTLCILGGLIGVLLGAGTTVVLARVMKWNTLISGSAVVIAFGFSALVGLFFGIWPARRAAKLDPITALRYE